MVEMMFERALNVFRTSGDTIKSTYRCLLLLLGGQPALAALHQLDGLPVPARPVHRATNGADGAGAR